MRIAYVCTDPGIPTFGTKGASIHVQEMLRAFLRRGASVALVSPRLDDPAPPDLAAVRRLPLPRAPKRSDAEALADWALAANDAVAAVLTAERPFDLVYERHALFAHAAMEVAAGQRIPSILELNAPLIEEQASHRRLARAEAAAGSARRAFAAASLVAAVSAGTAEYARAHGADPARVEVVPNGVDPGRFAPRSAPGGPFTIGFLGTLKPWHDTATLVEAFALLRRRPAPDTRLLIVGDGPERPRLEARLEALGLRGAAQFTGAVAAAEVPAWLARMHVACAPYHGDRPFYFSPLKLYEYMAAGLPIVASRSGDLPKLLDGGRLGVLASPGDPEALAVELARLATGPLLRARLGAAARAHAVAHHSWAGIAERVIRRAGVRAAEACV